MRIKEARLQNGISQKALATAIGVAQNTLSQYENGKREADYDTILKISEILNCPIDYLIRGEDSEKNINRIAELRKERNLTQQELALIIGVTLNAVNSWENENQKPDYDSLKKMAFFFNCSTDYLLGQTSFGKTFVFDEETNPNLDWAGHPLVGKGKEKKPTPEDERKPTDEDIMFALWGDSDEMDEDDLADVKRYAAFIQERKRKNG